MQLDVVNDGDLLVWGRSTEGVAFIDVRTMTLLRHIPLPEGRDVLAGQALSPDGRLLAESSAAFLALKVTDFAAIEGTTRVIDLETGRTLYEFPVVL